MIYINGLSRLKKIESELRGVEGSVLVNDFSEYADYEVYLYGCDGSILGVDKSKIDVEIYTLFNERAEDEFCFTINLN